MASPIGWLVDGFDSASAAPPWQVLLGGSATATQSGSQAIFTLPSSTAGSHFAQYATVATYDLTGDSMSMTIGTMVSTSVAASAYLIVLYDASNYLQWIQTSGTLKAQKVIAGVPTDIYSVAWSAATYKWLRIRENAGVTVFESSTNGISWTARGGTFTNVFAMNSLSVRVGASCGNVASPGSLRLDDVNINAGLASSWRWTQVEWPLLYRFRPVTLSAVGGQGYLAVASTIDSSGNLVSPTYYSGPLGSASGGYNALALASSQAVAQNNAVNLPLNDRWDLPTIVEGRFIRLYHRSLDASAHTLREYYPRRIVQADDIEAESIRAINIAAGAITADKIFVLNLAALSEFVGQLSIDPTGWIYQGTGTGASPTTGMKIYNNAGFGTISFFNASADILDLDQNGMRVHAVAGADVLSTPNALTFVDASANQMAALYASYDAGGAKNFVGLRARYAGSRKGSISVYAEDASGSEVGMLADADGTNTLAGVSIVSLNNRIRLLAGVRNVRIDGQGLYIGTAFVDPTVAAGTLQTDGNVGIGVAPASNVRLVSKGVDSSTSNFALELLNGSGGLLLLVRNDGATGFFGSGGSTRPTVTGSRGANAALASLLSALATLGLLTDSST